MSMMIEKARNLATERHAHLHLYDAARSPAITHIGEVASLVERHGGTEDMIAAAWLHDIVEDTDVTLADIEEWFGPAVSGLVDGLTDPPDFAALPLHIRKPAQAERLKGKGDDVKRIKICDQLSNVLRVMNKTPDDWDRVTQFLYIQGARDVAVICRGLCPALDKMFDEAYDRAEKMYEDVR